MISTITKPSLKHCTVGSGSALRVSEEEAKAVSVFQLLVALFATPTL